ncbi:diphthamide biosynthesis protein 3 [Planococcus citri]|uniref:diphthamide biosynthesis protein 3 n=1 Tax=Planococcus citri TaxID=170843 RepID=UPI0031F846AA
MSIYHDEVEIEDFEYDEEDETYYYPCPCGDRFQISKEELKAGVDVATCPSCSLVIKVIFDPVMMLFIISFLIYAYRSLKFLLISFNDDFMYFEEQFIDENEKQKNINVDKETLKN